MAKYKAKTRSDVVQVVFDAGLEHKLGVGDSRRTRNPTGSSYVWSVPVYSREFEVGSPHLHMLMSLLDYCFENGYKIARSLGPDKRIGVWVIL